MLISIYFENKVPLKSVQLTFSVPNKPTQTIDMQKKLYLQTHVVRSGILRPNTTNTEEYSLVPLHPQFIKHTINHLLVLGFLVCTFMLDRQHYIYKHTMAWDRNYILSKLKDRNCFASEKHVNFCIMLHMIFILHI